MKKQKLKKNWIWILLFKISELIIESALILSVLITLLVIFFIVAGEPPESEQTREYKENYRRQIVLNYEMNN